MTSTVAVVNLKGGTGKTTTAAFLAHVWHERRLRVLGVDADGENASLLRWSELADWPVSVVGLAVRDLHRKLDGITGGRFDVVVIDTPPVREGRGIAVSAVRAASHVLVPIAPTPMEYERMPAVAELVTEAAELRPDGSAPELSVLLTRTSARAASTAAFRTLLEGDGYRVLPVDVRRRERYAQAQGAPIQRADRTEYADAATAILEGAA